MLREHFQSMTCETEPPGEMTQKHMGGALLEQRTTHSKLSQLSAARWQAHLHVLISRRFPKRWVGAHDFGGCTIHTIPNSSD